MRKTFLIGDKINFMVVIYGKSLKTLCRIRLFWSFLRVFFYPVRHPYPCYKIVSWNSSSTRNKSSFFPGKRWVRPRLNENISKIQICSSILTKQPQEKQQSRILISIIPKLIIIPSTSPNTSSITVHFYFN